MIYIKHRQNSIKDLSNVNSSWGVEIDLRANTLYKGKIHVSHEPWDLGDDFEQWLNAYVKLGCLGPLILNTKEDGLEDSVIALLKTYQIQNYFFLDTALPTMVNRAEQKREKHFAVRFSKYEPHEFVDNFHDQCEWVWIDCFNLEPVSLTDVNKLSQNFKTCLVSPELQGGDIKLIEKFRQIYGDSLLHAVCTKRPDLWGFQNEIL